MVLICLALLWFPLVAMAQDAAGTLLLDKAAKAYREAGVVELAFRMRSYAGGSLQAETAGTIRLKGDKFRLETPGTQTWFDGKTQWTYVEENDEVTATLPTTEELRGINPYAFLSLYREGFTARMGKAASFRGQSADEVLLTSDKSDTDLAQITLYLDAHTHFPLFVRLEYRGGHERSEITVTSCKSGQSYSDKEFVFNPSLYPSAELIDLR